MKTQTRLWSLQNPTAMDGDEDDEDATDSEYESEGSISSGSSISGRQQLRGQWFVHCPVFFTTYHCLKLETTFNFLH